MRLARHLVRHGKTSIPITSVLVRRMDAKECKYFFPSMMNQGIIIWMRICTYLTKLFLDFHTEVQLSH